MLPDRRPHLLSPNAAERALRSVDLQSNLQHQFGLTERQARAWTWYVGANANAGIKVGAGGGIPNLSPINGKASGELGGNLSAGTRRQGTDGETASAIVNAGRQYLERHDFSAKVDRARQAFATDNYATFAGTTSGSRRANSDVFANASSVQHAVTDREGRSQAYSEAASRAEALSFDERSKLTQGAVDYLWRNAPGRQGLYGHPLDRADMVQLLNPTGADAAQWIQLREELLRPWVSRQADHLLREAPPVGDFAPRGDLGQDGARQNLPRAEGIARGWHSANHPHVARPQGEAPQLLAPVADRPVDLPSANWGPLAAPALHLSAEAKQAEHTAHAAGHIAGQRTSRTVEDTEAQSKFDHGGSNRDLEIPEDER